MSANQTRERWDNLGFKTVTLFLHPDDKDEVVDLARLRQSERLLGLVSEHNETVLGILSDRIRMSYRLDHANYARLREWFVRAGKKMPIKRLDAVREAHDEAVLLARMDAATADEYTVEQLQWRLAKAEALALWMKAEMKQLGRLAPIVGEKK